MTTGQCAIIPRARVKVRKENWRAINSERVRPDPAGKTGKNLNKLWWNLTRMVVGED